MRVNPGQPVVLTHNYKTNLMSVHRDSAAALNSPINHKGSTSLIEGVGAKLHSRKQSHDVHSTISRAIKETKDSTRYSQASKSLIKFPLNQ